MLSHQWTSVLLQPHRHTTTQLANSLLCHPTWSHTTHAPNLVKFIHRQTKFLHIISTVLDVFWIDATWSWCLTRFHPVHGFVCSVIVGGEVSIRGSGVDPLASESKASGRGSEDRFNKVLKYSCHLATDNSFPFADLVKVVRSHTSSSIVGS